MRDWHVGQKIVCVNAQPIDGLRNRFVDEYLAEGKVYKIRQILVFKYISRDKCDERVAFRLEGIVPHLINGVEYAFFHGRFRPLEPSDDDEDVDISVFLDDLSKVNMGLIRFQDEEPRELAPAEAGGSHPRGRRLEIATAARGAGAAGSLSACLAPPLDRGSARRKTLMATMASLRGPSGV